MTSNLIIFLLVLSFEDHFRFFTLFLSKHLNRNRYLYSPFCFTVSLQFLLATIQKGFCLIAQEGFGSLIFRDTG